MTAAPSFQEHRPEADLCQARPQWSFVSNLYTGKRKYDEANPIFGQRADADEFAINGTFFWHNLFGVNALAATFTAAYASADSDINFYGSQSTRFSTGLLYNF